MSNGHDAIIENVKVYGHGRFDKELLIKESSIIKSLSPNLNETVTSFPLVFVLLPIIACCDNA